MGLGLRLGLLGDKVSVGSRFKIKDNVIGRVRGVRVKIVRVRVRE